MTRRLAAAAMILAAPALSSCHTSFGAQTDQVYTPGVGVNDRSGMVDVLHALVVTDGFGGNRVIAGLANKHQTEADELIDVSSTEEGVLVDLMDGETEIPPAGFLQLADAAFVGIAGDGVKLGGFVEVTFTFRNAEPVTLNMPVVANVAEFSLIDLSGGSAAPDASTDGGDPAAIDESELDESELDESE